MPIWGAIAGAAIGAGMNYASNRMANNQNALQFNAHYNTTRQHALDDWYRQTHWQEGQWNRENAYNQEMWHMQNNYNEKWWNKQNEYDSPAAQIARFKAAGINPAAMFNNMSGGATMSPAQIEQASSATAQTTRSGQGGGPQGQGAHFNPMGDIVAAMGLSKMKAETDVLKKQGQLLDTENSLKIIAGNNQYLDSLGKDKALAYDIQGRELQIMRAKQEILGMQQDFWNKGDENQRAWNKDRREQEVNGPMIAELRQRIKTEAAQEKLHLSQQDIQDLDKELKWYEVQLNHQGTSGHDNLLMRKIGQTYHAIIERLRN